MSPVKLGCWAMKIPVGRKNKYHFGWDQYATHDV